MRFESHAGPLIASDPISRYSGTCPNATCFPSPGCPELQPFAPSEMKIAQDPAVSLFLCSLRGAVSRTVQVLLRCFCPLSTLGMFGYSCGPSWPLTCLREAEMCRRSRAEPLRQHRKGCSKLGQVPYCFMSGRHWGPMVTSNHNLLLPHGLPIDMCQQKLEQSLQKSKASNSVLLQGTPCSPCRCE